MSACLELVRFAAKAGAEEALAAARPAMEEAFRVAYPGLVDLRLGRLEDGTYADLFVWRTRADADHAQATEHDMPEFQAFVAHVERQLTHDFGTLVA